MRAARVNSPWSPSTGALLDTIVHDIGAHPIAQIDYPWAEAWIKSLKVERRLAPGTIRKRKGALSRVLEWFVNAHPLHLAANPLDRLPRGYSGYDEFTCTPRSGRWLAKIRFAGPYAEVWLEVEALTPPFGHTRSLLTGSGRKTNSWESAFTR